MLESREEGESMSDIKGKIKRTVLESRLYRDFSNLANELLKKQNASAEVLERANRIIEDEIEELAEQVSLLVKS